MSTWTQQHRFGFDLETTGADPNTARIVTASIVEVDPSNTVLNTWEWLVNPGVQIPAEATAVHGVSTEQAQSEGMNLRQGVFEISDVLFRAFAADLPVIAFNASYDFTVLHCEQARNNLAQLQVSPVIDPYIIDKHVDRFRKGKRTLSVMSEHYGIDLQNAHNSTGDTLATIDLATALAHKYPELDVPAAELHLQQIHWAQEIARDFEEYLTRAGKPREIDGSWPISQNKQ